MKTPAFILHTNFLTVIPVGGTPTTINNNDARFVSALSAIKAKDWVALEEVLTLPKVIAKFTSGKIKVFENAVTYKDKQIHGTVVTRLLEFMREGFPIEALCNFVDKLMENPSERSKEQLYNYLELYKLPICDDGDIIAQKKVNKEFKDFHTRTIDNSVGKIVEMDRKLVNDDPNHGCRDGLHIGSEDYVQTFGGEGVVILVKINPRDVVSIPIESSYSKMRVCRYEVIKALGDNSSKFNSDYAPATKQAEDITVDDDYISDRENNFGDESPDLIPMPANQSLGANSAYEAHKNGQTLTNGVLIVKPEDSKPRWFFRANKQDGWKLYAAPIEVKKKVVIKQSLSKEAAYKAHKSGKEVYSINYCQDNQVDEVIYPISNLSRSFFRKYNDWQLVK